LSGWTSVILAVPGNYSAQAIAMLIAAFPFAFALIRALRTGYDFPLFMGSARIAAWRNGGHDRRKGAHQKGACGSRPVGGCLRRVDAPCSIGGAATRDETGAGHLGRCCCVWILLRGR
jgi:hypothetical protein